MLLQYLLSDRVALQPVLGHTILPRERSMPIAKQSLKHIAESDKRFERWKLA
jgi:hypothetical protein